MEVIVAGKYLLGKNIGNGAFGRIYQGKYMILINIFNRYLQKHRAISCNQNGINILTFEDC